MNNQNVNGLGALILAAGSSERMGIPKPFLQYDGKTMFIDKIINTYLEIGCSKIVITIDNKKKKWMDIKKKYKRNDSVIFVDNSHPELERFYSVQIGILEMNDVNFCFLQNSDNPFISESVLHSILSRRKGNAYVVPNFMNKSGHPVLLGDYVMNYILSIDNLELNLKEVLSNCQRIDCPVNDDNILININTPEDYKKYFGGKDG